MNINIYYGGRGIIDDPTGYVITKMQNVLEELRVNVTRYNLYEQRNAIPTLPQSLKEADGVILATTVEWFGIGGYMQQFLDACWLYGDKERISQIYMCPIVMSTTYGEREAKLDLANAWEILGGLPCSGICGYIENTLSLEMNEDYAHIIEKKAENLYRTINQHTACFPASNQAVRQKIAIPQSTNLSPQESEQLSRYVADDVYVQRQKEDIQELASLFRDKLSQDGAENENRFLPELRKCFRAQPGVAVECLIRFEEDSRGLAIVVKGATLECSYGDREDAELKISMKRSVMEDITHGRMTFQRAFMSGAAKIKGSMGLLRNMDQVFPFEEQ